MSVLDLRVQALQFSKRLVGSRVANIYDINAKTYLLKLSVPPGRFGDEQREVESLNPLVEAARSTLAGQNSGQDEHGAETVVGEGWKKVLVLVESGARIHTTNFVRDKGAVPSGFTLKLRKHLRARRLESVRQVGSDRVLDLSFSMGGEIVYHLILEFYAAGNIILTDRDLQILTVLRVFRGEAATAGPVAVRERYALEAARSEASLEVCEEQIQDVLSGTGEDLSKNGSAKKVLSTALGFGPELIAHALCSIGYSENAKIEQLRANRDVTHLLKLALDQLVILVNGGEVDVLPLGGFILSTEEGGIDSYQIFTPYLLAQYQNDPTLKLSRYSTFDEAVDEYFSKIESQRFERESKKKEDLVLKKVGKAKAQLESHVEALQEAQVTNLEKAKAIERSFQEVDAAIIVLRGLVASAVDWEDLHKMIKAEKKNGNPVAQIIQSLHLERNVVTLVLASEEVEEDEGMESDPDASDDDERDESKYRRPARQSLPSLLVDVDILISAYANAERYYQNKRIAATKHEKAIIASEQAIKHAENKAREELSKVQRDKAAIREIRKYYWFEKFHWFISSENFLVVAGRDAQQNEQLVKRYLTISDVYVHADIHGASSVIVKNSSTNLNRDIPPLTLSQAGCFAMCRSNAWESKIVTSAWWVRASQVSKSAPTGEYLPTGSFIIRGRKNFLPPAPLIMGIGILFRVDESCAGSHVGERNIRGTEERTLSESIATSRDDDRNDEVTLIGEGLNDIEPKVKQLSLERLPQVEVAAEQLLERYSLDVSLSSAVVGDEVTKLEHRRDDTVPSTPKDFIIPEQQVSDEAGDSKLPTPYISASERRQRKRQGNKDRDPKSVFDADANPSYETSHTPNPRPSATHVVPTTIPRGKKAKLKKLKKYVDQDDEDRNLALELLGTSKMKIENVTGVGESFTSKTSLEDATVENAGAPSQVVKSVTTVPDHVNPGVSDSVGHRIPGWNRRQAHAEKQEIRRVLNEEGVTTLTDAEKDALNSLSLLTGNPLESDILHFAVTMCAPYSALTQVVFKVKLLPGTQKRGKGYRQAEAVFLHTAEKSFPTRVRELIKAIPEQDALSTILGDIRVQAPGLEDVKKRKAVTGKKK